MGPLLRALPLVVCRIRRRDPALAGHGAAGRVGTAVLELAAVAGIRMYGTCSARDFAVVERLGAIPIDYRSEDFVARARELTDGERREMESDLSRVTGKRIKARYAQDGSILGGAIARVGSTVYDGSVKNQLQLIKEKMTG